MTGLSPSSLERAQVHVTPATDRRGCATLIPARQEAS
jgi:hypothetical protein